MHQEKWTKSTREKGQMHKEKGAKAPQKRVTVKGMPRKGAKSALTFSPTAKH